jgi:hypothetical protein
MKECGSSFSTLFGRIILRDLAHFRWLTLFIEPRQELILFLRLAQAYKSRRMMQDRNRALVMAGTCAALMEMKSIAKLCRAQILQHNQGHMLRKWESFSEAIEDGDFQALLRQIRRKLPEERAEELLEELDYRCDVRKADHQTNESFAAAVMGVDAQWLREHFGDP